MQASSIHNEIAVRVTRQICHANDPWDIARTLVILESVIVGVLGTCRGMEVWNANETEAHLRSIVAAVRQRISRVENSNV